MRKAITALFAVVVLAGLGFSAHAGDGYTVKGEVVSIDSAGKTIVVDTTEGEKTVVFQETTTGFTEMVKPGASVEMTCFDQAGKACAHDIKVISAKEAGTPTKVFEGEVVSIDPAGKSVVIKNLKGEEMTIELHEGAIAQKVVPAIEPTAGNELGCEPMPIKLVRRGQFVRLVCFDSTDKFCASKLTVISPSEAGKVVPGATEVLGEVTAIDPGGKAIAIKTVTGEKTLYYQEVTGGLPFDKIERGKKVKAFCLDVNGKSCISDITAVE